jgi:hypothetical protein
MTLRRPPTVPALIFPAALAACVMLAACNRKPQLVPRSDGAAAVSADSLAIAMRTAQQAWDAPDSGLVAARMTAAVVLADLNAHVVSEPRLDWSERAHALLDSLDIGAEYAGAPCALVVNFFPASNPTAGSWPWLFTCGETRLSASPIQGQGLALQATATRGLFGEPPKPPGAHGVTVLFARRGTTGQQPILMTFKPNRSGAWDLAQTLGADSLGGTGTGSFETSGDSVVELITRTFSGTLHFEECATCPHVYRTHRFRWRGDGFVRVEDRVAASPYATFVRFVQALTTGDMLTAQTLVTGPNVIDDALRAQWAVNQGSWRAAPSTDETAHEMIFFRGMKDAWRVTFDPRGQDWVISGLEPTTRSLE